MYPDDGRLVINAPWTWLSHMQECNRLMKLRQQQEEQQAKAGQGQSPEMQTVASDETATAQEQKKRTKSDSDRSDSRWVDQASGLLRGTIAAYQPAQLKVDVGNMARGAAAYASRIRPMGPKMPLKMVPI